MKRTTRNFQPAPVLFGHNLVLLEACGHALNPNQLIWSHPFRTEHLQSSRSADPARQDEALAVVGILLFLLGGVRCEYHRLNFALS